MLRHVGILISIYLCIVVQSSVVADVSEFGRPFLPALLLVLIAAVCQPPIAVVWSGFVGFLLDGLSPERLGVQLGLTAILAIGLQVLKPCWKSRHPLAVVALCLLVASVWRILSPMTLAVLSRRIVDPQPIFVSAVRDAVLSAVLAAVVVAILVPGRWRKRQVEC